MCHNALDGWEEEDDPTTEHLKHASDCAWAVIMGTLRGSNKPDEVEDPTSERFTEARRATFTTAWPHEGKRGWVCQSEKVSFTVSCYLKRSCNWKFRITHDCNRWPKADGTSVLAKKVMI